MAAAAKFRRPWLGGALVVLVCACATEEDATLDDQQAALTIPASITPFVLPFMLPEPAAAACERMTACRDAAPGEVCCIDSEDASRTTPHYSGELPLFQATPHIEYRIPALVHTSSGALVALAEKRWGTAPDPDSGFIQTVYRVRPHANAPWGPERLLCNLPFDTCGNPTAVYNAVDGRIYVLMNSNPGDASLFGGDVDCLSEAECLVPGADPLRCPTDRKQCMRDITHGDRQVLVASSQQAGTAIGAGLTFETPRNITASVGASSAWDAVGPGAGIQLDDGRLVFGAKGRNIFRELDGTWVARNLTGSGAAFDESTVVQRSDGSLYRNDRATGSWETTFRRAASRSVAPDFTEWTRWSYAGQPVTPSHRCAPSICGAYADTCPEAFLDPRPAGCGSGVGHVHAGMGRYTAGPTLQRLMFTNPGGTRNRAGMAVRLSYDEGDTWPIGRQVVPLSETGGYTATTKTLGASGWGIGVLMEQSAGGRHSISYHFANLSWILCGRHEPLHIGGNAWLGTYTHAIRAADGTLTYHGSAGGVPVQVRSNLRERTDTEQSMHLTMLGFSGWVTASPSRPNELRLPSGATVVLETPDPGRAWCDAADGAP